MDMGPGDGGGGDRGESGSGKSGFEGKLSGDTETIDFGYTTIFDPKTKAADIGSTNSVDNDETYDDLLLALKEIWQSKEPPDQVVPKEGPEVEMVEGKGKEPVVEVPSSQPVPPRPVLEFDLSTRLRWTEQLHSFFVNAVDRLGGPEIATPKAIYSMMNVNGLTLYHLKSHLQKYRQSQKPENTQRGAHKDDIKKMAAGSSKTSTSHRVIQNNRSKSQANKGGRGMSIYLRMQAEKNLQSFMKAHQGYFNRAVQNPDHIVGNQNVKPLVMAPLVGNQNVLPLAMAPAVGNQNVQSLAMALSLSNRNVHPLTVAPLVGNWNVHPLTVAPLVGNQSVKPLAMAPLFGNQNVLPLAMAPPVGNQNVLPLTMAPPVANQNVQSLAMGTSVSNQNVQPLTVAPLVGVKPMAVAPPVGNQNVQFQAVMPLTGNQNVRPLSAPLVGMKPLAVEHSVGNQNVQSLAVAPPVGNQNVQPLAVAPPAGNRNAQPLVVAPSVGNQNVQPLAMAPSASNQNTLPPAVAPPVGVQPLVVALPAGNQNVQPLAITPPTCNQNVQRLAIAPSAGNQNAQHLAIAPLVGNQNTQPLAIAPPVQNPFQTAGTQNVRYPGMAWSNYYGHDFMSRATRPATAAAPVNQNHAIPFNANNPVGAVGPNNFEEYMQAYPFPYARNPTDMHPEGFGAGSEQGSDETRTSDFDLVDTFLVDNEDAHSSTVDGSSKSMSPRRDADPGSA